MTETVDQAGGGEVVVVTLGDAVGVVPVVHLDEERGSDEEQVRS